MYRTVKVSVTGIEGEIGQHDDQGARPLVLDWPRGPPLCALLTSPLSRSLAGCSHQVCRCLPPPPMGLALASPPRLRAALSSAALALSQERTSRTGSKSIERDSRRNGERGGVEERGERRAYFSPGARMRA